MPQDSDKVSERTGIWRTVTFAVMLVSGGAMGSLITYYLATRQTVVNYSVNTTSLGAGETTKSVLPTLKLQLDNAEIPSVYTHTIEISHGSGPELDQASLSITLAGARLYGTPIMSGPDPVHTISCKYDQSVSAVICSIGRLARKKNPYKVIMATDRAPTFSLAIDSKNATLEQALVGHAERELSWWVILVLGMSAGLASGVASFGVDKLFGRSKVKD